MSKFIFTIILILLGISWALTSVHAALVPCGRSTDDPNTTDINETEECTLCHLFLTVQMYLNGLVLLLGGVSLFIFIIIGFMFIFGSTKTEALTTAKKALTSAIIGFILVLVAWLIVVSIGTIMDWKQEQRGTFGQDGGRSWWKINCEAD